jgi:hypothetical protein
MSGVATPSARFHVEVGTAPAGAQTRIWESDDDGERYSTTLIHDHHVTPTYDTSATCLSYRDALDMALAFVEQADERVGYAAVRVTVSEEGGRNFIATPWNRADKIATSLTAVLAANGGPR